MQATTMLVQKSRIIGINGMKLRTRGCFEASWELLKYGSVTEANKVDG